jgi:predicted membrane channel-forming protein YqfA (hemolysin III family)
MESIFYIIYGFILILSANAIKKGMNKNVKIALTVIVVLLTLGLVFYILRKALFYFNN